MMGVRIEDPGQVEGMQTVTDGLGLLPLVTVMQDTKVVCQSHFRFKNYEWIVPTILFLYHSPPVSGLPYQI